MPELAEVKIMAEYINSVTEGRIYNNIRKVETSKQDSVEIGRPFTIKAMSRGKELLLHLEDLCPDYDQLNLGMAMGMTGNWAITKTGEEHKHAQLMFDAEDGTTLSLIDMRRFAKWNKADGWSSKRSPCPLTEHIEFVKHIERGLKKSPKTFEKPICELMMDQKWFNGIGNYLRAEILYRVRDIVNPFESAYTALRRCPQILDLCYHVVEESYHAGGGELKDWDNPYTRGYGLGRINAQKKKDAPTSFRDWLQCYQKQSSIKDSKKRTFWFDTCYQESADIYLKTKNAISNEVCKNI